MVLVYIYGLTLIQRQLIFGILIADSTKVLLILNLFTNAKAVDTWYSVKEPYIDKTH